MCLTLGYHVSHAICGNWVVEVSGTSHSETIIAHPFSHHISAHDQNLNLKNKTMLVIWAIRISHFNHNSRQYSTCDQ